MKTSYLVVFLLFSQFAYCQMLDDFQDGNFNSSPTWNGDTSYYKVNVAHELQSKGPASSAVLHLSTENSRLINTEWNFYVRLEFSPSTTNYAKVYLASDQENLKNALNGYYIKIGGETGSTDGIDLYKQEGTSTTKLIDGVSGHAGKSINSLRIKVIRDIAGNWTLLSDTTGGNNFLPEGSVFDNSISTCSYFGPVCIHSSTRKDLFYFDDFQIKEGPLSIVNAQALNDSLVEVSFNNNIDKTSAENPFNYTISSIGNPVNALLNTSDPSKVILFLNQHLHNGTYKISINNVKDSHGISIANNSSFSLIYKKPIIYGDLLITEIFPDPSPSIGLPEEEFVEIYNTTEDTLDLSGFSLADPNTSTVLPSYKISPNSYLIITNVSAKNEFEIYGSVLGVYPWPALNNSGDQLILKDEQGKIIFTLKYSDEWYGNENKKDGGWSLEMINLKEYCVEKNNWKASENSIGGSPGNINSVYSEISDQSPPVLVEFEIIDTLNLLIKFNENIDTTLLKSNFRIDENNSIVKAEISDFQTVFLTLSSSLKVRNSYHLTIYNIGDCLGNKISPEITYNFILPEDPEPLDVIINEVLFNPRSGGEDFVEIYNNSSKSIDLKNWELANIKKDTVSEREKINSSFILGPGQYLCLTVDPATLKSQYHVPYPEKIFNMSDLPSYYDESGSVVLLDNKGKIMDRFDYNEDMHFPLITNKEGVSLERISFSSNTNDPNNWHSASENSGFATPGYENSQHHEGVNSTNVSIEPKVFTPDQDAWNDIAFINYRFKEPGYIANITVFDIKGRAIKKIANNQLLSMEGFFQWDGSTDHGQLAATGHYIVLFETFNLKGETKGYKQTVVLSQKF